MPVSADVKSAFSALTNHMGLSVSDLLPELENALAIAYKRAFRPPGRVDVELNIETGELRISSRAVVVDPGLPAADGIALEEALRHDPAALAGQLIEIELATDGFSRLAAQTARQVMSARLRDVEDRFAVKQIETRRGELASGVVRRLDGATAYLELLRAEGILEASERIPGEQIEVGQHLKAIVLEPRHHQGVLQVVLSRSHRQLVRRLLEAEVPEISQGVVLMRMLVREPGLRTKVAVSSSQPGLDPVGACIGPKGVRIRAVTSELGAEKVDVIEWSDDPGVLVRNAIGPAQATTVELEPTHKTAVVYVPATQLSLAIGRDGQNARLAAKVTGWKIDIRPSADHALVQDDHGNR